MSRSLTLAAPLDSPLYTGAGTSNLVPFPWNVAINGRTYQVDLSFEPWKRQAYQHQSVDVLREQADSSTTPSESSLNPNGLWRRSQDSWHHGAGQLHLDRKNSDQYRFRTSKGVNPWTPWRLSLLNDTSQILSSANTNLAMCVAGSRLYVADGSTLKFTSTLAGGSTSWTTVTGTPGVAISSICSDGVNVYIAVGASGVYTTTTSSSSATQLVSSGIGASAIVGFVKGRLMVADSNKLYNVTSTSVAALPSALFTSNYASITWVGFTEGQGRIFAAGYSGDKSVIYSIGITSDGTSLSAPVVAGELPSGEVVRCIQGYLGDVFIGSDSGFRLASADSSGNLTIGALVGSLQGVASPVKCATGYDRFVWFGWTNYDGTSTGLGRADLSTFTQPLVPAFASDLMATAQGTVQSVVTFGGTTCFAVSGSGFYQQASTYVSSGTITSGAITYDLADSKVPVFVDLLYQSLSAGTIQASTSYDGSTVTPAGTASSVGSTFTELPTSQTLCYSIELTVTINSGNTNTVTPNLNRYTLRSAPAPVTPTDIVAPIRLDWEQLVGDGEQAMVPSTELQYLELLRASKQVVTYQYSNSSAAVQVRAIQWIPETINPISGEWGGIAVVSMRTVV